MQPYFEISLLSFTHKIFEQNFCYYVTVYLVRIWSNKNADKNANTFSRKSKNVKKRTKTDEKQILCKFILNVAILPKISVWLTHLLVFTVNYSTSCWQANSVATGLPIKPWDLCCDLLSFFTHLFIYFLLLNKHKKKQKSFEINSSSSTLQFISFKKIISHIVALFCNYIFSLFAKSKMIKSNLVSI